MTCAMNDYLQLMISSEKTESQVKIGNAKKPQITLQDIVDD